jgi:hypothetical protein
MDKESLEKVQDKIADLLNNVDIPITDKLELLINLIHFLNDYDDNIKVLEEHRLRLTKED